jgi:SAM-dependent methyltransferase
VGDNLDDIATNQLEIYGTRFKQLGDTPEGFHWRDKATQSLRFERLIVNMRDLECPTICDIGCGTGGLHGHLLDRGINHSYSGFDIVPEMIEVASTKYPNQRFEQICDISELSGELFDYVFCSGVFFIRGESSMASWRDYCFSMIEQMYNICNISVSFNFLGDWSDWEEENLAYFSMAELHRFCRELSRFVIVDASYPLFEGTMTVQRAGEVREKFPEGEFSRYFGVD